MLADGSQREGDAVAALLQPESDQDRVQRLARTGRVEFSDDNLGDDNLQIGQDAYVILTRLILYVMRNSLLSICGLLVVFLGRLSGRENCRIADTV